MSCELFVVVKFMLRIFVGKLIVSESLSDAIAYYTVNKHLLRIVDSLSSLVM